jgi:hypothetical protein
MSFAGEECKSIVPWCPNIVIITEYFKRSFGNVITTALQVPFPSHLNLNSEVCALRPCPCGNQ